MIKEFVKAWDANNKALLKEFQEESPSSYEDIVKKLVNIVINPYLETDGEDEKNEIHYPMSEGLDIEKMTVIDDGEYQGTTLYIIPYKTYQPDCDDYVMTHNYYGSCSGCDTFEAIEDSYNLWGSRKTKANIKKAAKDFHTLALHILQHFKPLGGVDNEDYGY